MAYVIRIPDARDGYVDLVRHVRANGKETSPRGMRTWEIEDAIVEIGDPYDVLPLGVGRRLNSGIAAVEACQLLAGVSWPKLVVKIGPQFAGFAEDNGLFHGAYGLRTRGQYAEILERLRRDPDTRQALVTIWNPELDLLPNKRDYPCTILHQFRIRDGQLNMSVFMRSNDVWRGAAYDFFQFTRVQIALASLLDVRVGWYNHHVGSLHVYETDLDAIEKLHVSDLDETFVPPPPITGSPDGEWAEVEHKALSALLAVEHDTDYEVMAEGSEELWYASAMRRALDKARV